MSIRVGLIGAGRMGKVFAKTLAFNVSEVDLVAVADPNESTLHEVETQFSISKGYKDYRELLDSKEVEAVVVTSPTSTHAEVIVAAAAAGKNIFSEKPLSQNLEDCDQAIATTLSLDKQRPVLVSEIDQKA